MIRVFALLIALVCACPVMASEDIAEALAGKPALNINFDGTHHVDVCHNKGQNSAPQTQTTAPSDVAFDRTADSDVPTGVLVGAGVVGIAAGAAVAISVIKKTTVAVH
jgi:hypothetical protein